MYAKGGYGVFKAELWPAEVDPRFKICCDPFAVLRNKDTPPIFGYGALHQKIRSLNCDLLKKIYRYGIFWMVPGEFSCPDGSEYVWQRGVESLQG